MSDSSKKKRKSKKKKDSQLIIRINTEEREQFIDLCEDLDTSAAREIRRFIREFVDEHLPEDERIAAANEPGDDDEIESDDAV